MPMAPLTNALRLGFIVLPERLASEVPLQFPHIDPCPSQPKPSADSGYEPRSLADYGRLSAHVGA